MLLFIAFLEERECVEMLQMMQNGLVSTFPLLHAINAEKNTLVRPSQQMILKLSFLEKVAVRNPAGTRLDSLA